MLDKPTAKTKVKEGSGPFSLPSLLYDQDALAPVISARTLAFHHGKHHKGYIDKLNKLVEGTPFAGMTLDEVVKQTAGRKDKADIFNNAAQAWNHAFYWRSLSPKPTKPGAALAAAVTRDFGDLETLNAEFRKKATGHFASGWAWLVLKDKNLKVVDTADADTPLTSGGACLLTIDAWEHAYYLDRQNDREAYVKAVVDKLLNWDFASANFTK
jgi:Fe-Mn family superoxide dismutase